MTFGSAAGGERRFRAGAALGAFFAFVVLSALWPSSVSAMSSAAPADYRAVAPARLVDTRAGGTTVDGQQQAGGALGPGGVLDVTVLGRGGVPVADVAAVVLNLTVTGPTAPGWVAAFATGSPGPLTSNLNFAPGQTVANLVVAKVGSGGRVTVFNSSGSAHLIVDVEGWLPGATRFGTTPPSRLVDTRPTGTTIDGQTQRQGAVAAGGVLELPVLGRGGVPAMGVDSVILNLTATQPGDGFVTAYPSGSIRPNSSNLNMASGQTIANLVIVKVGDLGRVAFSSSTSTQLIVDVFGWTPTGSDLSSLLPARLADTRPGATTIDGQQVGGGALPAGGQLDLPVVGRGGVPVAGAGAVVLNLTATAPVGTGWLTAFPGGTTRPPTSNLNYAAGQTIAGSAIVRVGANGMVSIYSAAASHVIVDVVGWLPNPVSTSAPTLASLEDSSGTVAVTAVDRDGGSVAFSVTSPPASGTLGELGSPTCDGLTPSTCTVLATYTPAANFNGGDALTVRAVDGEAYASTIAVAVAVTPVNDAPSFTKGGDQSVLEDSGPRSVTGWATAISKGAANESGQVLDFQVTGNTNAALFAAGPAVSATGDLTYTPAANANGTASITVRAHDNGGTANSGVDISPSQTFTLTVTAVNDAPSFARGADETVLEDSGAHTVAGWATGVSAGPADESGQALDFVITGNTNPALFSAGPAISPSGVLAYTLAANANGAALITLHIHDSGGTANGGVDTGASQSFVVTVTAVNDAPSFTKGADQTVLEDAGPQAVAGWATSLLVGPANESGQSLDFPVTGNTNPGLFSAGPTVSPSGVLAYTPAANANGVATVTVHARDGGGTANGGVDASGDQTFTVSVTAVNDAPSFSVFDPLAVLEDAGAQTVAGLASSIAAGPANESAQTVGFQVTGNTNPGLFSAGPSLAATGTLTYTPVANANGSATITVNLKDNGGTANGGVDTSATRTFTVTVTAVNDVPSFTKGADEAVLQDSGGHTVAGWATGITVGPANESGQAVDFLVSNSLNALFSVQPAVSPVGTLSYTVAAGQVGTATVSVRIHDNGGTANGGLDTSAVQTASIVVIAPNRAPVAQPVAPSVGEDTSTTVTLTATDADGEPVTFALGAGPSHGSLGVISAPSCNALTPRTCTANVQYSPAANYNGSDAFTYTAADGIAISTPATVSITVSPVNDPPAALSGSSPTNEDAAVPITLTGSDIDEDNLTFSIVTGPTSGTLGPLGSPSCAAVNTCTAAVTYTPNANANGADSFSFKVNDGTLDSAAATVSITVTAVNDAPSFARGADETVLEDSGAHTVAGWATGVSAGPANESGQTLTFNVTGNTTPGLFSVAPAVSSVTGNLTYTLAANANGSSTITLTLSDSGGTANGGVDTGASQSFVVTVTAVNDAPSFTKGADQNVLPSSGPRTVVGWVAAFSPGPPDEAGQTVSFVITGNTNPGLFAAGPSVANNGTLTFTPATGQVGVATITLHAHDDSGTSPGVDNSPDQSFTIAVTPPNATPVAVSQSPSTNEDTPLPVTLSGTDAGDDNLTFSIVTGPTNGTLGALGAPSCAAVNSCTATVTYTPNANYNGPDPFTFKVNDGTIDSANGTVSIAVNAVNDAPVLTQPDGTLAYTENALPAAVAPNLTAADVDSTNLASATIQITGSYATGQDLLSLGTNPQNGITAGAFNPVTGTLSLTGSASAASYQAALRDVRYVNTSDAPTVLTRTISFTVNDGALPSNTATRTVSVTAVNDPPVVNLDAAGPLSYTEQAGFINLFGPAATVTDADTPTLASLTVSITSGFDAAFDTLDLNTAGFSSSFSGGTLTITKAGGTPADFTTALRNVRFRNTDNDPDHRNDGTANPSDADRSASVIASDGAATSPTVTRNITITPVNDAPSGPTTPPTVSSIRNTTLVAGTSPVTDPKVTRAIDLKGGSVDLDGLETSITVVPVAAAATANGGRITLTAAGDLRYEPPAGVTLTSDTSSYQLTDGITASAPITLTINLTGKVWYVADQAPAPRDGTSARPFDTLAGALAVATTNDAIHIRRAPGDGTLTGGVTLQSGQKLIGEGVALTNTDVGTASVETLYAAGTKPVLTASNADVVTLAATTQIAGLTVNPDGTGGGLAGASVAGVTVRDVAIDDTGTPASQPGIELTGTGNGVTFTGVVTIAATQGSALSLTNAALGGTLASVSASADTNGPGVSLTTTTGSLTFTTVALTTTNQVGFLLNNADGIDVVAGSVSSTNRPAVDATSLDSGSDLTFTDVHSSSSTSDGVNLDGIGSWTFSAGAGSTIAGASTVGFDVNGGSGTVTYAGSIANSATAKAVEVTGRSGNTTISGNITGSGGTGLNVANNTAGTTTFSGATKKLDTGPNAAVTLAANTGHAIAFSGGGLDIDTTSGAGFSASSGGTVTVQGAVNTVNSGTGTAVSVTSTTIGAVGITLQSVSSTGAANGILLNATGTVGSLMVTGAGGTCASAASCTGGAIQNATVGVSLSSTKSPALDRMAVLNTTESGIKGTGVDGVTITNSKIDNSGSAHVVVDSSNIGFNTTGTGTEVNLTGVVTITGNTLTNAWYQGIDIFNYGGTISNATISNNTITSGTTTGGGGTSVGSGIRFVAFGGPSAAASITRATLDSNSINNFPGAVGLQVQCGNANSAAAPSSTCGTPGSGTNVIAVTNNGINAPGGGSTVKTGAEGLIALVNGVGQGNFNISNNDIRNNAGTSISSSAFGNAVVTETINANTVVSNNTVGSQGIGIGTSTTGGFATNSPQLTATISSNNVSQTDGNGILAVARDSSNGQLKVKVLSNTVAGPLGGVRQGIRIDAGNSTGDNDVCAQISGNSSAPTVGQPAALGIGLRKQGTIATVNSFGLVGLSPASGASPAVEGYVNGLNPSGGGTLLISASSGFTSCPAF